MAKTLFLENVFDWAFVQPPGLAWGAPSGLQGRGPFVLVCLAAPQSPGSPDEKSLKKSRFSGPLPQLRQGKHKRTIPPTVASSERGHPFLRS